jgi:hypothetical protein
MVPTGTADVALTDNDFASVWRVGVRTRLFLSVAAVRI